MSDESILASKVKYCNLFKEVLAYLWSGGAFVIRDTDIFDVTFVFLLLVYAD